MIKLKFSIDILSDDNKFSKADYQHKQSNNSNLRRLLDSPIYRPQTNSFIDRLLNAWLGLIREEQARPAHQEEAHFAQPNKKLLWLQTQA
jgi:hypothetical protein